ncbi:hepatic lectin-like [Cydia strobilella]|uniref:hepatic lectin-like n=1 Tax=Cydia strobilella TaxID=1100964 RepID=UPI0030049ABC
MFRFGLLCHVLFAGWQHAAGHGDPAIFTDEYVREADAWLRLHLIPATWSDAAVRCQLEGGVLATPTSSAITQAMKSAMDKNNFGSNNVFIGATNRFSKGDFKSLNGENLADSLGWAFDEPDNTGDCLALTGAGALAHVSCTRVLPYFCSKSTHNCGSNGGTPCGRNGYEWEPRTGSCYKFHGQAKTWRKALAACHAEGGHLAVINSKTESSVLEKLYDEYADTITGAKEDRQAFVGFSKFYDGVWATIYGETLSDAGFEGWDSKEPSNGDGILEESCGSIHRNGKLNDAACFWTSPFICEITP